jgi:hypothetical protein
MAFMHFPFKEIRKKLLAGDFSGLFRVAKDSAFIHPSEVAKLFIYPRKKQLMLSDHFRQTSRYW